MKTSKKSPYRARAVDGSGYYDLAIARRRRIEADNHLLVLKLRNLEAGLLGRADVLQGAETIAKIVADCLVEAAGRIGPELDLPLPAIEFCKTAFERIAAEGRTLYAALAGVKS